jgi:hypothetical protein
MTYIKLRCHECKKILKPRQVKYDWTGYGHQISCEKCSDSWRAAKQRRMRMQRKRRDDDKA